MRNRERVMNYTKDKTRKMTVDGTYRLTPAQSRRVKKKSGQWRKRNEDAVS